ncbi:hypothetical protein ACXWRW_11275, partial [Streptococcus pyogenes]
LPFLPFSPSLLLSFFSFPLLLSFPLSPPPFSLSFSFFPPFSFSSPLPFFPSLSLFFSFSFLFPLFFSFFSLSLLFFSSPF